MLIKLLPAPPWSINDRRDIKKLLNCLTYFSVTFHMLIFQNKLLMKLLWHLLAPFCVDFLIKMELLIPKNDIESHIKIFWTCKAKCRADENIKPPALILQLFSCHLWCNCLGSQMQQRQPSNNQEIINRTWTWRQDHTFQLVKLPFILSNKAAA